VVAGEAVRAEEMPPEVFFGDKAGACYASRRWTVKLEDCYVTTSVGLCLMPGKHVCDPFLALGY